MLRLMIPAILALAAGERPYQSYPGRAHSAASEAQVKFAVQNKYDDTGPGSKGPQYAYNAYKTLDEAIIAYLNDPDTKLPEYERDRVLQKLAQGITGETHDPYQTPVVRFYPKSVEEYTGYKKPDDKATLLLTKISPKKHYQPFVFQGAQLKKQGAEPYKVTKIHHGSNPVSVAHYSRGLTDHIYSHPNYQFTFDVHGADIEEKIRNGERVPVPGYTFLDPTSQRGLQYGEQIGRAGPQSVPVPELVDQAALDYQRKLHYGDHVLIAKPEALPRPYIEQAFLGDGQGNQRRPVTYGDQLFESRIEQGNPQYLEKRGAIIENTSRPS